MNTLESNRLILTYGVLPSRDVFEERFDQVCPNGKFSFSRDDRVGTCELSSRDLWQEILIAHTVFALTTSEDNLSQDAGSWVSDVLCILGIEWI